MVAKVVKMLETIPALKGGHRLEILQNLTSTKKQNCFQGKKKKKLPELLKSAAGMALAVDKLLKNC